MDHSPKPSCNVDDCVYTANSGTSVALSNTQNLAGKSPAQNQEGHHPVNPHKPSQTVIPI